MKGIYRSCIIPIPYTQMQMRKCSILCYWHRYTHRFCMADGDVITSKHLTKECLPYYWDFFKGIFRSPVESHQKGPVTFQWRHNECDEASNHQPYECLLNSLFRSMSKKTLKLRVTGLGTGNSPETDEVPTQMASNAESVSIWWRHHGCGALLIYL